MKQLMCIVCPNGCRITAEMKDGQYVFSGNKCARGADFAKTELTAPMRSVCTTVRTVFRGMPALSVRTDGEVPKEMIPDIMRALAGVLVSKEMLIGETVVSDILGTGCDVIATCDMPGITGREEMPC
jgi:CxxC motif-containing protein